MPFSPKSLFQSTTAGVAALGLSAAILASLAVPATAQDVAELTPATYPAAQARSGSILYRDNCAGCHGDRLQGALDGPPLAGEDFRANWFGQPASDLYEFIANYMPQDRPGALTPEQYADILAHMLKTNGVEAGADDAAKLPGDAEALKTVGLPAAE